MLRLILWMKLLEMYENCSYSLFQEIVLDPIRVVALSGISLYIVFVAIALSYFSVQVQK